MHARRFGDVDAILGAFYADTVRDVASECGVSEGLLRESILTAFITEVGTRGFVYRNRSVTAGMPNEVLDMLEQRHLIRSEHRAGARWYELTHDRMIAPIEASNRQFADAGDIEASRLTEDRDTAYVRSARAERALTAGQFDKAEREAERAVQLFEAAGDAWAAANAQAFVGDIRYAVGDYEGTLAAWNRAADGFRSLDDGRALARILSAMGRLALEHDQLGEAFALYDDAIAMDATAEAYSGRASVSWYQGRDEDALRDFTYALTLEPNQFEARNGRGQLLADAGRAAEALADLEVAIRMAPDAASRAYARSARA
ncbi:MAG TPA: tetratricopeptide repeat protein, partial [Candidatus Dormibacteraeota bacterium]|nr:tetratricopeptide repeat protein [Candidatus Dormibacteraeota bacterium]